MLTNARKFGIAAAILALLSVAPAAQAGVAVPIDGSYKLVFADEFNGNSLDKTKWNDNFLGAPGQVTTPAQKDEYQAYDPAQVSVSGGYLRLKIRRSPVDVGGYHYENRSGMVTTFGKFDQAYGYFEARIYLPGNNGRIDNWPAFWLAGKGTWPTTGELDIMEGLQGTAGSTFHSDYGMDQAHAVGDYTGWHVFAALWRPGEVKTYYDGKLIGTLKKGITSSPQFLLLNLATGGCCSGRVVVPSEMLVDYVHVYSNDPRAVAVAPPANYGGPGDTGERGTVPNDQFSVDSPGENALLSLPLAIKGKVGTKYRNVAAYLPAQNYKKLSADVTPSAGSYQLTIPANALPAGTHQISVVAFTETAGRSGGESKEILRTVRVQAPPPPPAVNLVLNPGFESGMKNWSMYGQAAVSSNRPRTGGSAARLAGSGAAGFEQVIAGLKPNTAYVLKAYLKVAPGSDGVIGVKDYGGAQAVASASGSGYQLITIPFRTGAYATSAKIFLYGTVGRAVADDFSLLQQ